LASRQRSRTSSRVSSSASAKRPRSLDASSMAGF
jgi:hypothetical protein